MYKELLQRRGLSLDRLHTLVAFADAGSLARASGGDPVKQSQYSRQLRELEGCFGCKLVERQGRTLALTEAGRDLVCLAREHMRALAGFASSCGKERLMVRIGAGEGLLTWLIVPRLTRVERGPAIAVRLLNLRVRDVLAQLAEHKLEFGVVRVPADVPAPLKSMPLGRIEYRVFASKSLIMRTGAKAATSLALPLAALEGDPRLAKLAARPSIGRDTHALQATFECTSLPQIHALVAEGLAAGILPALAAGSFDRDSVTTIAVPGIKELDEPHCLVWHPRAIERNAPLERLRSSLANALRLTPR